MLKRLGLLASVLVVACNKEDETAKKEAERLRLELAARDERDAVARENERLKSELAAAQARTEPSLPNVAPSPPVRPAGQNIIDTFTPLKEGQQLIWRIAPGRYRVRVTTSNSGIKVKWVGAPCASSKEVKVYDNTCDVAAEAQLLVENPGGMTGLGPTEQIAVKVTTL